MSQSLSSSKVPTQTIEKTSFSFAEMAGMALLCAVFLLYSYLRSRHKMFWGDEIMGALVLKQPTLASMFKMWNDGIDSSGIWWELLARLWTSVFGLSEYSLRFFSSIGVCASACLVWITARRFYPVLPVAASVFVAYAVSLAMIWQLANGRTYGLFLTAAALVFWLLFRGEEEDARKPSLLLLSLTCIAYCMLVGSHILGALYACGFLGIQLFLDVIAKRFRPSIYLAALPSVIVLWFSRKNIISTTALGKPSYWTVKPTLKDLLTLDHRLLGAIAVALLLIGFSVHLARNRRTVYLILLGFAGFDLLIWEYSRIGTSIYVDRYLLPFCFAGALLLCELLTQLREVDLPHAALRRATPLVFIAAALASLFVPRLQRRWMPFPDFTTGLLAHIPGTTPILEPDVETFVELEYYHQGSMGRRLFFPADWSLARDRDFTGGVSGLHEMDNFKADGIYAEDIVPSSQLLDTYPDFYVVATTRQLWMRKRILDNPAYSATKLGSFRDDELDLWAVHRK